MADNTKPDPCDCYEKDNATPSDIATKAKKGKKK